MKEIRKKKRTYLSGTVANLKNAAKEQPANEGMKIEEDHLIKIVSKFSQLQPIQKENKTIKFNHKTIQTEPATASTKRKENYKT